jgi:tRNA U34 5-carboxymethylaminomethyl modifying GTPase MnmE/TrmE
VWRCSIISNIDQGKTYIYIKEKLTEIIKSNKQMAVSEEGTSLTLEGSPNVQQWR